MTLIALFQLFLLLQLIPKLKNGGRLTDHKDIILIESIAARFGIDFKDPSGGLAYSDPINSIKLLIQKIIEDIDCEVGGVSSFECLIPLHWDTAIRSYYSEHGNQHYRFFSNGKVLESDLLEWLHNEIGEKQKSEIIKSQILIELKSVYGVDWEQVKSNLDKESVFNIDVNEVCRMLPNLSFIFWLFNYLDRNEHLILDSEYDKEEIECRLFVTESTALKTLLAEIDRFDKDWTPTEEGERAYEILINSTWFVHLEGLESCNPKLLGEYRNLYLLNITGNEGFKEQIAKVASTAATLLAAALKALKDRLLKRKQEGSKEVESLKSEIDKGIEKLKSKKGEVNKSQLDSLKNQIAKAGYKDVASQLESVNSYVQLTSVLSAFSSKLADQIRTMKEAEDKVREAESKVNEATKAPSGATDNADPDVQKQIKEQMAQSKEHAKESMSLAGEAINKSLKSITLLRSIRATIEKMSVEDKVDGNEAWMD